MIIRHPLRGALGGLLLGFGLAWLLVQLNFVPVGNLTVVVLLLASVLLGTDAPLVRRNLCRSDAGAVPWVASDQRGSTHAHPRPDRLGQDAGRLPVVRRSADQWRRPGRRGWGTGSLRKPVEGAHL